MTPRRARRVTKASVLRALRREGACARARRWLEKQPSLRMAYARVMRRAEPSWCRFHLSEDGCWLLKTLDLHCYPMPTYEQLIERARQRGWWR